MAIQSKKMRCIFNRSRRNEISEEEIEAWGIEDSTGTTSEEGYQKLLREAVCVLPDRRREKLKTPKQGIETQESSLRNELC